MLGYLLLEINNGWFLLQSESVTAPERDGAGGQREQGNAQTT